MARFIIRKPSEGMTINQAKHMIEVAGGIEFADKPAHARDIMEQMGIFLVDSDFCMHELQQKLPGWHIEPDVRGVVFSQGAQSAPKSGAP